MKHLFFGIERWMFTRKHVLKKHRLQLKGGLILDHCRQLNFIGRFCLVLWLFQVRALIIKDSVDYVMLADQICWESLEGSEDLKKIFEQTHVLIWCK